MNQQNRPKSRVKKVVREGKGVEKRGEGLGTGPVGSKDAYAGKKDDEDRGLVDDRIGAAMSGGLSGSSSSSTFLTVITAVFLRSSSYSSLPAGA